MLSEKDFENIICKYPELIEDDLTLKGQQLTLYGQRMDILFEDKHGNNLIIELKLGPIKDEHIGQILRYEGTLLSTENSAIRVMLVGNRVPPNIRRSLDHHGIAWKEITISQLKDFLIKKEDKEPLDLLHMKEDLSCGTEKMINLTRASEVIRKSSGVWIFQVNLKFYPFFKKVQSNSFDSVSWKAKRLAKEIRKGDIMLFWIMGESAGIYAMGQVISDPRVLSPEEYEKEKDDCLPEYYEKFPEKVDRTYPRFRCKLIKEFIDKPILKKYLIDNEILKDLSIITTNGMGTNFRVTEEQWKELERLYPSVSNTV